MQEFPLGWIVLLPLLGSLFAGTIGRKLSKNTVGIVSTLVVFGSFVISLAAVLNLLKMGGIPPFGDGAEPVARRMLDVLVNSDPWVWISAGSFKVEMAFWMDPLTGVMALLVTFVGGLIHLYSIGYMHEDKSFARYFSYLNLFTAAMLILILGKNLLILFIGWEGVGLASYLLIGFWYEDTAKATAGKKAFLVNRVGDLGFLLGIFAILACQMQANQALTLDFEEMRGQGDIFAGLISSGTATQAGWDWTWATLIGLFLLVGAAGKSAQIPLYVWLPDAMAGPTPVSALMHAATMVTAGVFMVARMGFLYAYSPEALAVTALIGGVTALFAAIIAIPQNDIKKVLAYSTISQLGLMFVAMGTGAFWVGIFHVLTHAFFKACLFLGSGSVIHAMGGEQDISKMGGLRRYMPSTFKTFTIATFAISGFPLLAGFFSKDEILWKAFSTTNPVYPGLQYIVYGLAALASLLTAFYMTRVWVRTFLGECRADEETRHHLHESPSSMTLPLWVLAILSVVGGTIAIPKFLAAPVVGEEKAGELSQLENFLEPTLLSANERLARAGMGEHAAAEHAAVHEAATEETAATAHAAVDHTAAEWGLMGLAVLIALSGMGVGYLLYRRRELPNFVPAPLYKLALRKFYIDEIYGFFIVKPLLGISYFLHLVIDEFLIDSLLVRGGPRLVKGSSMILRTLQGGNVQKYAAWIALGSAILLYLVLG